MLRTAWLIRHPLQWEVPRVPTSPLTQLFSCIRNLLHTLILFTYRDHEALLIPVTIFAAVAAPVQSPPAFLKAVFWIWCHLLQFTISNQYIAVDEDAANRPWRPIPSGRMTLQHATILRWVMLAWCTVHSALHGNTVLGASLALSAATLAHNELDLSKHWFTKNLCNSIGYTCFEVGATAIMSASGNLDSIARLSVSLSAAVIVFTITMQDFPDIEGDAAQGRVTFPIAFPRFSRYFTSLMLVGWSLVLGTIWGLSPLPRAMFLALGLWVSGRNWISAGVEKYDAKTYLYFNIWLFTAHLLPVAARL